MDVFRIHERLLDDYRAFTSGFVDVRDRRLRNHVQEQLDGGEQWPDPWLSLNPNFEPAGTVEDLVAAGVLHEECARIFRVKGDLTDPGGRGLTLHRHQREAIEVARQGDSYVLTTGTGSGKSLAYMVPIVDRVLRQERRSGVKAIVVYPMNALANSQLGELRKFLSFGYGEGKEPVTFSRYTGQEGTEERERILKDPPDILLTNYVMLELLLTRPDERQRLIRAARGLEFLVLDELHTYRGRQGADVAFLVRRVRDACESPDLQCIGTSATMASGGTTASQKSVVAGVATRIVGAQVTPEGVIGETLKRATVAASASREQLAATVRSPTRPNGYDQLRTDPLAAWIESTFGIVFEPGTDRLVRQKPVRLPDAAAALAAQCGESEQLCGAAIRQTLLAGSRALHPETGRTLFAFRLHQFLSKGDTIFVSLEPEHTRHVTSQYQVAVPGQPDKPLFPLSFCRECGQEYLAVARIERSGATSYGPRRDRDLSGGDAANGYLFVCSDNPWPVKPEIDGRLPDSWLSTTDDGQVDVVPTRQKYLPRRVQVDIGGNEVQAGGLVAAFVPSPFTFCLRCRVSYEQTRGQDFGKLATLDAEGRSSAVSVVSASIVRSLRELPESELDPKARKLLTFVDNRQDASLQAGHFNDFVQVSQLRGALYRAAAAKPDGLTHEEVTQRVADTLALPFEGFAANPEAKFSQRDQTLRALREVLAYRLYIDLQRGWRVTMPNRTRRLVLQGYDAMAEAVATGEPYQTNLDPPPGQGPRHPVG